MYNIIKDIDFSLFEVSIITFIPEKGNTRFADFQALPITIYQLCPEHPTNPLSLFVRLKNKVKQLDPDILHAHCPRSLYLMTYLPRRYKRVYTIHIYPGLQQKILYGKLKGALVIWLNHYYTSKLDCPIGCAESIADLYKKNKGWTIQAIPNGSSYPVFESQTVRIEAQKERRAKLGLTMQYKYFIAIGRFSKEKNMDKIAEAFSRLSMPDLGLIMIGDGPMLSALKKTYGDKILFTGFKKNVYDYLIAADYYVSASDVEGLANTLLESMSVGLPVVLSDIPSHREVVTKANSQIGFIADQTNVEDIASKMRHIISIDENEAANSLRTTFSTYYTSAVMSKAYQSVYSSLSISRT